MLVKKSSAISRLIKNRTLLLMSLPAVIICLLISYFPMVGILIAFKRYNYTGGIFFSPWDGLRNFEFFFTSGKAFQVILNTIMYNIVFIISGVVFQVGVAVLVAEMSGKYFKKICQSIMFLPFFISWVVVGAFMYNLLNYESGILNSVLAGLSLKPVDVYSQPTYWYFIMPILSAWKGTGYGSVIYLAAIMGIDVECYNAAEIDGANRFQRIFHITLPLLTPPIVILLLLSLGRILRGDFDMFYQIIGRNSLLYSTTDIIDTFVFRSLLNSSDISMTSAAAFIQSVLCLVIILSVNKAIKIFKKEYALF